MITISGKEKIEKDYQEFERVIEQMTEDELRRIREKANQLKSEAEKTGESVENSINTSQEKLSKKKS